MRAAVFCGSAHGTDPAFIKETERLVQAMADRNVSLVYGGGHVGLMGTLADTAIASGVHVIGVMPHSLVNHELAHRGVSELKVVKDMHERKSTMAENADFFIALPGGAGTLEEIFEAWTWAQLGLHNKACAFFNVNGYFDSLFTFFERMIDDGFMKKAYSEMLIISDDPDELIEKALSYTPPPPKWVR
ncbi:TIGR00730 family Rossman fold protein [Chimaeribacter arupi]|uniref:Cytokinin riboside 5'-monophosphate phosphoribohydrolase n=1 Tax=Chimaeribacter arupi TaxID=2060066 RepID=A0A2N5ENB8_9GAMM|nr:MULTISPECIES: TIGR00730 family Rossman fold protein [Yersiniaceae]MDV5140170.1 TIGR00730 family Rossman fold protein [Chimaeribacter arupi]PLR31367.1 TIGR00730 family Rossman fold protein [Chimaeribacter arupi]PLR42721.1 TIGR00730 family Rossman fold protein [Chimaeribacter arupi]PLR44123.1 TIGR00730 family Rossman fold protein [Chimaeribacter arupi]PLR50160.1 TIGR00730 family Rossman fold protein [Chimaeribacter arupi]